MRDRRPTTRSELTPPRLRPPLVRRLAGHPSEAVLERHYQRYAGGPGGVGPAVVGPAAASRLDRHLARCAECGGWLRWRGALGGVARELALRESATRAPAAQPTGVPSVGALAPAPNSTGALAAALRRRAAGERVILPPDGVPPIAASGRRGAAGRPARAAAVAAGLALAAALLARPASRADAGPAAGELTIAPRTPRIGDTLAVAYRPNAALAGAPRLRLRAVFYPDDDTRWWTRPAVTAWLTPDADGTYHVRVAPPPGAAYARFAVEDSVARAVDAHGGEPWDVVLGDAAGRPRVAGFRTQSVAAGPTAWERQRQLTLEATRVHPDHPSGWWARTGQDLEAVGSARADSVLAAARPRVARLDTALGRAAVRGEVVESWAMLDLASFAEAAGLPDVQRRWQAHLLAERPRSVAAYSLRVQRLWAARPPPAAQLDSLERWWGADPDSLSLFLNQTVGLAVAGHDSAAARRWAARVTAADRSTSTFVAQQLVRDPGLAALAVAYAQADAVRLTSRLPSSGSTDDAERPLEMGSTAWAGERGRRARAARAVEGEGLLALGRAREAAAALSDATAAGWDADAFRLLGEARLAVGDTAGALGALASAAADPRLGRALADTLGRRLGARARGPAWADAVADARRGMHARVLATAVAEAPRGDPRVVDAGGRRRPLSALRGGRVAVVAVEHSQCGWALADLPALAQLRAGLAGRPVTFVALTREAPGGTAERDLRARGLTVPLWYDRDGEATAALDARGTPTYLVFDRAGAVRWRGFRVRDAAPVLDALLAQGDGR